MHRTRPHVLLAVVAVAGLLLVGCGGDEDVDAATFADHLYERTGEDEDVVPRDVVDCITDAVFDEWSGDQAEINRIYRAADEDELGNETRDRLNEINQRCFEQHLAAVGGEEADDEGTGTDAGTTTSETPADEGDAEPAGDGSEAPEGGPEQPADGDDVPGETSTTEA